MNNDKCSSLHFAAANGHTEIVKLLIAANAEVNAVNNLQKTPLHLAARSGHTEIVKLLIENGAKI